VSVTWFDHLRAISPPWHLSATIAASKRFDFAAPVCRRRFHHPAPAASADAARPHREKAP
jgi:hypothetical protein